jgi:methylated-DNA-[protein]-cysteine S-methyltransferase
MKNVFFYQTPIGTIGIAENGRALTNLFFKGEAYPEDALKKETPLIKEAWSQLQLYFEGKGKKFDLPLEVKGTDFQKAVWKALQEIPYGETRSYKDIAVRIGNEKACRAVGMANNRNPVSIIIPCHRVIGADGKLVGYGGGLGVKEYLLNLEKTYK